MSKCATQRTQGFYFGYFWVYYMITQVIGNYTGAVMITRTSGPMFFLIFTLVLLLGVLGLCFISKPIEVREQDLDH